MTKTQTPPRVEPKGAGGLYRKPVAIDRERHKDVRIAPLTDFRFAARLQTLPVTAGEFREVHKEYPLVFARAAGEKLVPLALLGLRKDENLFVKPDGGWDGRYLPAFIRRYPFIFADSGEERLALCFDEAYAGVGDPAGQPLFEGGAETPYLKGILEFMSAYQNDFRLTEQFCKHLDDLGLLTRMSAMAEMKSGQKYLVNNFMIVDEAKLKMVDSVTVGRMFQSGELVLIYAHLMSLSNLGRLIDMLGTRPAALRDAPAAG